jgi:hypothetical protein
MLINTYIILIILYKEFQLSENITLQSEGGIMKGGAGATSPPWRKH